MSCARQQTRLSAMDTARVALTFLLLCPFSLLAEPLAITHVQPSTTRPDPAKGETVQLRFELSAPAEVTLELYDGRDLLVRQISGKGTLPRGEHSLAWDLRDQAGHPVPPEAYTYVLEAHSQDGNTVRYDLADQTGGETITARDVKWDAQSGHFSYVLDRPSRVNLRVGLENGGPLLHTLIDWVVRPAGLQQESWNGKDASSVLDLTKHPKLAISVQAFALPENSILVGPRQTQVRLIDPLPSGSKHREKSSAQPRRMYSHAQQPLEARGDFKVQLTLPKTLGRSSSGLPIISAVTPVRLEVDPKDRERALTRRFEPVFFIDGQFAFENEVGFVPMTWNFDPAALNDGEHFLTVNLRGYEGNFGMATVKILIHRQVAASSGRK